MEDDLYVSHEFPAALDTDAPQQVFAVVRYHRFDPSRLEVRLHFLGTDQQKIETYSRLRNLEWNFFWLYGRSERPTTVEVLGISGGSGRSGSIAEMFSPHASAVQIDLTETPSDVQRKYHFTAQLTPSGILIQPKSVEIDLNGEIRNEIWEPGEVLVDTELGSLHAREYHQSYDRIEHSNTVRVMVERAAITGNVTVEAGKNLSEVNERLRKVLDDLSDVISLCYRTPVQYYEIAYFETEPRAEKIVPSPVLRRRIKPKSREEGADELINFRDLINGGLNKLYEAYRDHPEVSSIRRAIRFMVGSYDTVGLEQSYFLAYAALDAAVGAASSDDIEFALGSSPFRKLCSKIRDVVGQFANERGLTRLVTDIDDKLAELRRRSTRRKMDDIRAKLSLTVDDLWTDRVSRMALRARRKVGTSWFTRRRLRNRTRCTVIE